MFPFFHVVPSISYFQRGAHTDFIYRIFCPQLMGISWNFTTETWFKKYWKITDKSTKLRLFCPFVFRAILSYNALFFLFLFFRVLLFLNFSFTHFVLWLSCYSICSWFLYDAFLFASCFLFFVAITFVWLL